MRLCLIGNGWFPDEPGGLNRYFRSLYEALSTYPIIKEAVVLGPAADAPQSVIVASGTRSSLARRLAGTTRAVPVELDILDVHFALYGFIPSLLARARGVPLFVHFHGPWADESVATTRSPTVVWAKRRIERAVYRRARELVTLSGAFKRLLVERYGVSPWRITVVPPGVDLLRYSPDGRSAARNHWGIDGDIWVALALRRLVPRMGIDILLRAWAEANMSNSLLIIGGDGSERDRLTELAKLLGIEGSVRFAGPVPEMELPLLYRAADISIVPSRELEGFGLIVLESLACGTPSSRVTPVGFLEVTTGLRPQLVVPAGDVKALAAELTSTRSGMTPSRQACRTHAESFTWQRAARRHVELYERAIDEHSFVRAKPRVVYLDHTARLSGGELALLRLLPAIADEVDAHVILAEDGPLVSRLIQARISVEVLPMTEAARGSRRDALSFASLPGAVAYTLRLTRRLGQLRPDLVHTNSLKAGVYGTAAARLAGVPSIWHVRDRIARDYLPVGAVRLVQLAVRRLPTAVVANSRATLTTLPDVRRTFVVPSPIAVPDQSSERNGGPLRVGMVGRIAPWKGQHVFIDAFARAFPVGAQEAVVIGAPMFGDDEVAYFERLKDQTNRLGLRGRLRFTGFREPIADELNGLDVLVHASTTPEPFGQVVLEGMASGLAVVATALGAPLELVDHGRDGLLVPPGDPDALAEALCRLELDPQLRANLGAAGRRKASAFTPAKVAESMMRVYGAVLSRA